MEETKVAIQAAREAGRYLRENFDQVHNVREKSQQEIVTEADVEAERIILAALKKDFPGYSILSEEKGKEDKGTEFLWVVDPLDGSTNYSIRNPFFDISIALAQRTAGGWDVISGVVYAPFTKEVFFAEKGEGVFLNGERISVSKEAALEKLLVVYCNGYTEKEILRAIRLFSALKPVCRDFNRMRAGALELAYVADGRLGGYVSPGGKPWDAAAGSLLVSEAGGKVTDFQGAPWSVVGEKEKDILATNGKIHQKLLEVVGRI